MEKRTVPFERAKLDESIKFLEDRCADLERQIEGLTERYQTLLAEKKKCEKAREALDAHYGSR